MSRKARRSSGVCGGFLPSLSAGRFFVGFDGSSIVLGGATFAVEGARPASSADGWSGVAAIERLALATTVDRSAFGCIGARGPVVSFGLRGPYTARASAR